LERARGLLRDDKPEEAMAVLSGVLAERPEDAEARELLSLASRFAGERSPYTAQELAWFQDPVDVPSEEAPVGRSVRKWWLAAPALLVLPLGVLLSHREAPEPAPLSELPHVRADVAPFELAPLVHVPPKKIAALKTDRRGALRRLRRLPDGRR
jgi:hypothetical protein